jgi:hypothetical protein
MTAGFLLTPVRQLILPLMMEGPKCLAFKSPNTLLSSGCAKEPEKATLNPTTKLRSV